MSQHGQFGMVAILAGTAWLAAGGCAQPPAAEVEPSATVVPANAAAAAPAALDTRTRGWEPEKWYSYALKLTTAVSFGDGANTFDFDLDGVVQITPTAVTPDAVTLYVAVANPRIVSRIPRSQPEFDKVAAQIGSTGCFFALSGGRVTEMRAPRGFSGTAANAYREIASAIQFARTVAPASRYTAEEYDTTGQYVAEYEFDRDQGVWHKRKQRYVAILAAKTAPSGAPGHVVPQIDKSEGTIRLFADGRLQSIDLRNAITVTGAQQPIHSTTSLSLQTGPSEAAHQPVPDWNALMSAMQRTGADEPYGTLPTIESLDKARIGSMTFDTAVAALERLAKEKGGAVASSVNGASLDADEKAKREKKTDEESRLFIALSAIFREQPATIAKAVQKIKTKSPAAHFLAEALSAASSPTAQSALVALATSKALDPVERTQITMALSRTPKPDPKSVDMLKAILATDPFSEVALLGLGTYARRFRDAGSFEQARDIGTLLVDRLQAAPTTTDRLTALRAITNSGYGPALPQVTAFLTDGQDEIRVAAVRALQSMNEASVDDVLAERLRSDASSDVRISALSAANVRQPSDVLAYAVENAATSAPDPHVRYRAVELLASWTVRRPDVRSTLEVVAKNDGEARIRDRAQSAL